MHLVGVKARNSSSRKGEGEGEGEREESVPRAMTLRRFTIHALSKTAVHVKDLSPSGSSVSTSTKFAFIVSLAQILHKKN
jgi:hypothetical protein